MNTGSLPTVIDFDPIRTPYGVNEREFPGGCGMREQFEFLMPVQVPDLRTELRTLLGLSSWPQLLLRIGYCLAEPVPTPRRPLDEVLVQVLN